MKSRNVKLAIFIFTALVSIGCDRVTKNLAKEHLQFSAPKTYLNNIFTLEYAENTGAALSLGDNLPQPYNFIILSVAPLLVMLGLTGFVLYNLRKLDKWSLFALSLIIAGGMGNIIDRMLYDRHVTDFMIIGLGSLHTGIFNVADVCVTTGVIMMLLTYLNGKTAAAA